MAEGHSRFIASMVKAAMPGRSNQSRSIPSVAPFSNARCIDLARIIHEKCAIKAKPLISLTTMRMGCLMKFFAMKFLAQVFGGLGRFRAVR